MPPARPCRSGWAPPRPAGPATPSSRPAARSSPTRASARLRRGSSTTATAANADDRERQLPPLAEGHALDAYGIEPKGHETQPPARFTEASLVKRLEELGVGRPSTYASIMGTIQDRGYVWKKGTALVPSFTAFAVVDAARATLPDLVDYAFTARMEDDLDDIAERRRRAGAVADRVLLRPRRQRRAHRRAQGARVRPSRRDRCSRRQLDPDRRRRGRRADRGESRSLRARTCSGARTAPASPTISLPTSSRSRRPSSCSPRPRAIASSATIPPPDCRSTPRPAASAPTCSSASSTTTPRRSPRRRRCSRR